MTISKIPTTKIQQKPSISKFSRITATNPPTKCSYLKTDGALWSKETGCSTFLLKKVQQL